VSSEKKGITFGYRGHYRLTSGILMKFGGGRGGLPLGKSESSAVSSRRILGNRGEDHGA